MKSKKMMPKKPKALKGALKQTEGYTPKEAMATGKPAGMLGGKAAKRREKRLANVPM